MTNNSDEFENHEHEEEIQHDEGEKASGTGLVSNISQAWRSKPLFKLVVLMIAVGAIVAASFTLFSGGQTIDNSRLVSPPNLNVAPGGPTSPYMKQQTDLANDQRSKDALAKGGSALPTPIGQSIDINELSDKAAKNDELTELKAQIETLRREQTVQFNQQRTQAVQQVPQPVQVQPQQPPPFDTALSDVMQHQMTQLVESWAPTRIQDIVVTKIDKTTTQDSGATAGTGASVSTDPNATNNANNTNQNSSRTSRPKAIVPSGTVSYAQMLTEANSDVPGPILAQIVSGPLAGARAVGQFKVVNNYSDYLILQFKLANLKGKEYSIDAIALDPQTTLGAMATEVDERYFSRVVLPAGAAFLQGVGSALGQSPSSTTTNGSFAIVQQSSAGVKQGVFQGLAQSANTAGQFLQNQANNTKPLVVVAAGTPMGLFFVSSVYDPDAITAAPNGMNGYAGYPNAVNGYPGYPNGNFGYANGMNGFPNGNNAFGNGSFGNNSYGNNPYGNNGYSNANNPYGGVNQSNSNMPYSNTGSSSSFGNGGAALAMLVDHRQ